MLLLAFRWAEEASAQLTPSHAQGSARPPRVHSRDPRLLAEETKAALVQRGVGSDSRYRVPELPTPGRACLTSKRPSKESLLGARSVLACSGFGPQ
jgi:hypothetical protein